MNDTVNTKTWIFFSLLGVCLTLCLFVYLHDTSKMNNLANQAKRQDLSSGYIFDEEPFLGGEVSLQVDRTQKGKFIAYRVSNQTYEKTVIDLNKSRIVGEYIGSRTKQFLKGMISGKEKKSKHDE